MFTKLKRRIKGSRMKIMLAMCLISMASLSYASEAKVVQQSTVTISTKNISLNQLIWELKNKTGLHFTYNTKDMEGIIIKEVNVKDEPVHKVLDKYLENTGVEYKIVEGVVVIKKRQVPSQQPQVTQPSVELRGRIVDVDGEPLMGAVVMVKGTSNGTAADFNGYYELKNVIPGQTIVVNYMGKETIERIVTKDNTTIDFTLKEKDNILGEVIVTGYQTISRERAVGSFDIVSAKDIENKTQPNLMERLEGMVSGLNNFGSTNDKGVTQFTIRGVSSLYANRKPLFVVDGMPYEGDIALINPNDVINVSVLKDATANSIYGAQAANGVIVVTTRGGKSGKTSVKYTGNVKFTPKPDIGYLGLINSSDLIDLQVEGFKFRHAVKDERISYNPVIDLLYQNEAGSLSDQDLESQLELYRRLDNRKQIEDEFGRVGVTHQHNLSVSGGNERNTYAISLNYLGDAPNQKESNNWRVGLNLKDQINFTSWLRGQVDVSANFSRDRKYTGAGQYTDLQLSMPSYYMLRDENGQVLNIPSGKSQKEQDRLLALGLLDESYSPITNHKEQKNIYKSDYYRIQTGLAADIIEGLSADVKFQFEKGGNNSDITYFANSQKVRSMINNAATYNKNTQILTLNVPRGGQLQRMNTDHFSYTLRAQLNYSNEFGKHDINALMGAERRLVQDRENHDYYMGYDNESLELGYFNPLLLREVRGSQGISGTFHWDYNDYVKMKEVENRYVSFYANASYTYNRRYSLNGSIRIDQSNLFGTDPKYQYRPLWSLGAGWHMKQEDFMKDVFWVNQLSLRVTHGIGGNVAKNAGPYLQFSNVGVQYLTGESAIFPDNPTNKELRWEKTATTNVGVDASLFNSRLNFSFDFYNKSTTDLLGYRTVNSIRGWSSVLLNYGDMYNRGVELSLNSINVKTRNFTWNTDLNFSYNKNKLTNLMGGANSVSSYVSGGVTASGYPMNSLFSYRYAGIGVVNDRGVALVYNKDGEKVQNVSEIDDLVYSGTRDPKYTASLFNKVNYKDFELSFLIVYYGGHKLRKISSPILSDAPHANVHKSILNRWKKPGDELNNNVVPGYQALRTTRDVLPWSSADVHVRRADYAKLRDITLTYRLPKEALKNLRLEGMLFTFQMNNVLTISANKGIDPEAYALNGAGFANYTPELRMKNPMTFTLGTVINF